MDKRISISSILIVDDDKEDIALFIEAVRNLSASLVCHYSYSAVDALSTLDSDGRRLPDVIFLDLLMPGMDGKTFLERLKKSDKLKDIRVIMYATLFSPADQKFCSGLGIQMLKKPDGFNAFDSGTRPCPF